MQAVPSPNGHGWQTNYDHVNEENEPMLFIKWISQPAVPKALFDLVTCGCSTESASQRCCCKKSNMPCTAACHYNNCSNVEKSNSIVQDELDNVDE